MTQFDDRERAFETMYARDQEMQFKIVARRNRLLGQWAAKKMGLTEAEADAYAKDVIRADFEEAGDEDVVRKLLGDLTSAGVEIDEAAIRAGARAQDGRGAPPVHRGAGLNHADGGRRDRDADPRRAFPTRGSRSSISPATATIMRRGWSRRASAASRASGSTSASMRRWAAGWATSSTR